MSSRPGPVYRRAASTSVKVSRRRRSFALSPCPSLSLTRSINHIASKASQPASQPAIYASKPGACRRRSSSVFCLPISFLHYHRHRQEQ